MPDFTIVTTTCNNIEWVSLFLESFVKTATNKNRQIIIVDSSTEKNYKFLLAITAEYSNVKVLKVSCNFEDYMQYWNIGIDACTSCNILFCHIDIVFLRKHWDCILTSYAMQNKTFGIIAENMCYRSVFLLGPKQWFVDSQFDHDYVNGNWAEHGKLTNAAAKFNQIFVDSYKKIYPFGEIIYFENKEWIYHSLYSSRIKNNSKCRIPAKEYRDNVAHKNFSRDIEVLKNYDSSIQLSEYLINYVT